LSARQPNGNALKHRAPPRHGAKLRPAFHAKAVGVARFPFAEQPTGHRRGLPDDLSNPSSFELRVGYKLVSETRKASPQSRIAHWLSVQDPAHLFITTVTLAEVWHGFQRLPPNHPRL